MAELHLMGNGFTVADAYLFTILGRTRLFMLDTGKWPALPGYAARIAARPTVQQAMKAEGLIQ